MPGHVSFWKGLMVRRKLLSVSIVVGPHRFVICFGLALPVLRRIISVEKCCKNKKSKVLYKIKCTRAECAIEVQFYTMFMLIRGIHPSGFSFSFVFLFCNVTSTCKLLSDPPPPFPPSHTHTQKPSPDAILCG